MSDQLDTLVGKSEADAIRELDEAGWKHRVVARDGEHFMVTMDYRTDRANLSIQDGIVKSIHVG